jgi:GR25 family glycosyltransferase involved in LPS biosynthesis
MISKLYLKIFICFAIFILFIALIIMLYKKISDSKLIQHFNYNKNKLTSIISQKIINKINVPIYYINLDRSPQRQKFMEDQFKLYNITNYKRIVGIDGKQLKNTLTDNINGTTFTNNYPELTKNEVGCLLSHLKAIRTAYNNNLDQVLILEDDCSLDLMFFWEDDKLTSILNKLNKPDWEIFQLYTGNCINFNSKKCSLQTGEKDCWGCVAYLINRKGMEKIINFITTNIQNEIILGKYFNNKLYPTRGQSDIFVYQIAKTYYLETPLFCTNNSNLKSTIATFNNGDKFSIEYSNKIIDHYIKEYSQK